MDCEASHPFYLIYRMDFIPYPIRTFIHSHEPSTIGTSVFASICIPVSCLDCFLLYGPNKDFHFILYFGLNFLMVQGGSATHMSLLYNK